MRLTMVGTGYVGLVTGVCFAGTGNDVTCLDLDARKIDSLRQGRCPIYEPGLDELLERNIKNGRLHFTTDPAGAYRDAEIIFICVGTPSDATGHADLKYVMGAADDIARALQKDPSSHRTIVVKSTVPVGTTLKVRDRIRAAAPNVRFAIANNPEFLKEGDAINDFNKPDRVVVGVENEQTGDLFRRLYDPFVRNGHPIYVMDILSSEMVKYASNNFLATKISFINEMANLCEAYGADIAKVREGMCADKRIGSQFLYPGLGYGGSCFPKDTLACIAMGKQAGVPVPLSSAVHETNQRQRDRFFARIESRFASAGGLRGKTLAFWGLAFKPRTDDVREAPALTLIAKALAAGASVRAFDPVAGETARAEIGPDAAILADMYEAARGSDALVISTDWDDFKSPDLGRLGAALKSKLIFDGRNLYRPEEMIGHGFEYICVGRPVAPGDRKS
ncbi:MAG: UDP-glucose/GDP-mannose dehydrogenase family protein [Phycisphaerales bacterium]|nr:UDP-glucose/GDP-mannose dehydrogenase family protein [Planctomycetota bacterium]